jgi:two-component system alkaline phosphatase synthesis response regulator PhoP
MIQKPADKPAGTQKAASAAEKAPSATARPAAQREAEGTKILVVDDNAQNLELLVAYLDGLGCQVLTAVDGIDALEKVTGANPDLILLDIMMPRMSGFEVCRKLKSGPATRDIPIIMVTALNELGDIERGVECGTDDFISKPVNRLELVTRVKSLLRVRHLKNELDRTLAYLDDIDAGPETKGVSDAPLQDARAVDAAGGRLLRLREDEELPRGRPVPSPVLPAAGRRD